MLPRWFRFFAPIALVVGLVMAGTTAWWIHPRPTAAPHTPQSGTPTTREVAVPGTAALSAVPEPTLDGVLRAAGTKFPLPTDAKNGQAYISGLFASVDVLWADYLRQAHIRTYTEARMRLVSGGERYTSRCKIETVTATTQNGFFCHLGDDQAQSPTIILPTETLLKSWDDWVLGQRLSRTAGAAVVFVILHEYGHFIQFTLESQRLRPSGARKNGEHLADCYAGAALRALNSRGDFSEVQLASIFEIVLHMGGDREASGSSSQEPPPPHGSGLERQKALSIGFAAGKPLACVKTYWR